MLIFHNLRKFQMEKYLYQFSLKKKHFQVLRQSFHGPRSTQPPVAPATSRLQYGRRRNANALPERGHIERIEPILAIISVEKLLIFQPKWAIYMFKNII